MGSTEKGNTPSQKLYNWRSSQNNKNRGVLLWKSPSIKTSARGLIESMASGEIQTVKRFSSSWLSVRPIFEMSTESIFCHLTRSSLMSLVSLTETALKPLPWCFPPVNSSKLWSFFFLTSQLMATASASSMFLVPSLCLVLAVPASASSVFVLPSTELWTGTRVEVGCYTTPERQVCWLQKCWWCFP